MPNRVSLARLFFAVSLIWSSSAQGVSASPQNNASAPTYSPIIGASYVHGRPLMPIWQTRGNQ